MKKIIEVNNVSFAYTQDLVLKDVNLEIKKGDFIGFIGSNGSGKSTMLKLLVNLLKQQAGEIKLFGIPITKFRDWAKIGYISQSVKKFNNSFPANVKEIVAANLYSEMGLLKILTPQLEKRVNSTLKLVGLENYKTKQIGQLSGGEQQRVFLARTLVLDPEIIFLDEPLVGIDSRSKDDIFRLLKKLNQELGLTIVMISHDLISLCKLTNRIALFRGLKILIQRADEFDVTNYLNHQLQTNNHHLETTIDVDKVVNNR